MKRTAASIAAGTLTLLVGCSNDDSDIGPDDSPDSAALTSEEFLDKHWADCAEVEGQLRECSSELSCGSAIVALQELLQETLPEAPDPATSDFSASAASLKEKADSLVPEYSDPTEANGQCGDHASSRLSYLGSLLVTLHVEGGE
ncbi:MAG: hypothetical protein ACK5MR_04245 [Cumulibacter sp.]